MSIGICHTVWLYPHRKPYPHGDGGCYKQSTLLFVNISHRSRYTKGKTAYWYINSQNDKEEKKMRLIIASNNRHKLEEIKAILGDFFGEILSMAEAGIEHETVEDGSTFMENAIKKAREIAELSGCCALADDSGVCVDALDGAPGVYSARFSGVHGDDKANNALMLKKLENSTDRRAHYACAIALVYPGGQTVTAEGFLHGEIGFEEEGENGFGYDPLFVLPEYGLTAAQLSPEEKNRISHRARALAALCEKLGKKRK